MSDAAKIFIEVTDRLKTAMQLTTDAQLAEALGFARQAWSQRKARNSLPSAEIEALIEREQLNPEYVWQGTGPLHVGDDGDWASGLAQRLARTLSLDTYRGILVSQGYKDKDLRAIAAGKQEPTLALLRDARRYLMIDLNWLLCDEPGLGVQERTLVQNYRRCSDDGKKTVDCVVVFAVGAAQK